MSNLRFDLNDIDHEPSDEALAALMDAVAEEVRRRDKLTWVEMRIRLQQAIKDTHRQGVIG